MYALASLVVGQARDRVLAAFALVPLVPAHPAPEASVLALLVRVAPVVLVVGQADPVVDPAVRAVLGKVLVLVFVPAARGNCLRSLSRASRFTFASPTTAVDRW